MTPKQCRAARALLGWNQESLARAAGCSVLTVRNFEKGRRALMPNNRQAIVDAFAKAGIEFIPDGVRQCRKP